MESEVIGSIEPTSAYRSNSALSIVRIAFIGAIYLYSFNTLPEIFYPYFPSFRTAKFWLMQAYVFSGYALLTLAALAGIRLLDLILDKRRKISSVWRIALGGTTIFFCMLITLLGVILPGFQYIFGTEWGSSVIMLFISSISGTVMYACVLMHRAAAKRHENRLQIQLDTDGLSTALDRAELSMLEAQIEPHFLFNTLAHVKRQYDLDAEKANHMLTSLIAYLSRAMPALRRDDWTVGDELDLIKVYLEILEQRFGPRLRFSITASEAGKSIRLPALVIATLVENSVRHGLAPKREGGIVTIEVKLNDALLQIEVCDNGVGFRKTSGTGLGLATVHARLRNVFGSGAELLVVPRPPAGVRASIQIPRQRST